MLPSPVCAKSGRYRAALNVLMAIFRLQVLLVLDGVKMGAMIALNGHFLGNATDQFIRYVRHVPGSISSPVPAQNWPRRFDVSFGRLFFVFRSLRWATCCSGATARR